MIIDAYNTTQDRRGRSDYLSGVKPGEKLPAYTPFDVNRILDRMRHVSDHMELLTVDRLQVGLEETDQSVVAEVPRDEADAQGAAHDRDPTTLGRRQASGSFFTASTKSSPCSVTPVTTAASTASMAY